VCALYKPCERNLVFFFFSIRNSRRPCHLPLVSFAKKCSDRDYVCCCCIRYLINFFVSCDPLVERRRQNNLKYIYNMKEKIRRMFVTTKQINQTKQQEIFFFFLFPFFLFNWSKRSDVIGSARLNPSVKRSAQTHTNANSIRRRKS
jgi:hypothetical protein